MENLLVFENSKFGKVRTVMIGDKPYFVGNDIAKILEYKEPHKAIAAHCDGGMSHPVIDSLGRNQNTIVIPEGDVYRLIIKAADQSQNFRIREKAKKFESWICDEILPQIRKTGGYIPIQENETDTEFLARAYLMAYKTIEMKKQRIEELENKIETDKPLVEFAETVTDSTNTIDIGEFAKLINNKNIPIGRNKLFEWLRKNEYLMRGNIPYQVYIDRGIFKVIEQTYGPPDNVKTNIKTLVTGKGQIYLLEKLKEEFEIDRKESV